MKNFVKSGEVLAFTNATGDTIYSGGVVVMSGLIGVSVTNVADGEDGEANLEGVYELPSAVAIPAIGTPLYWNETDQECDTDHTVGPFIGNCAASVADASNHVRVLLPGEGRPGGQYITQQAHIATVATADGSDAGTTQTLANALKVKLNTLITELQDSGILAAS